MFNRRKGVNLRAALTTMGEAKSLALATYVGRPFIDCVMCMHST